MRTPEQGHTVQCQLAAITHQLTIQARELLRVTDDHTADVDFRLWLQDNGPLHMADLWLGEDPARCVCPEGDAPTTEKLAAWRNAHATVMAAQL